MPLTVFVKKHEEEAKKKMEVQCWTHSHPKIFGEQTKKKNCKSCVFVQENHQSSFHIDDLNNWKKKLPLQLLWGDNHYQQDLLSGKRTSSIFFWCLANQSHLFHQLYCPYLRPQTSFLKRVWKKMQAKFTLCTLGKKSRMMKIMFSASFTS